MCDFINNIKSKLSPVFHSLWESTIHILLALFDGLVPLAEFL